MNAFAIHVVHCIAATAAYADDLDDAMLFLGYSEVEDIVVVHIISFFRYSLFHYYDNVSEDYSILR